MNAGGWVFAEVYGTSVWRDVTLTSSGGRHCEGKWRRVRCRRVGDGPGRRWWKVVVCRCEREYVQACVENQLSCMIVHGYDSGWTMHGAKELRSDEKRGVRKRECDMEASRR